MADFINLPLRDADGAFHVVVEAPRGSVVKMKYEPRMNTFMFKRPMLLGVSYPYGLGLLPEHHRRRPAGRDGIIRRAYLAWGRDRLHADRSGSWLLRPIFVLNHRWAVARGEESLRLELVRRRASKASAGSPASKVQ